MGDDGKRLNIRRVTLRVETGVRAIPTWAAAWRRMRPLVRSAARSSQRRLREIIGRRCGAPRRSIGQDKRRSHARVTGQSSVVIGVWASVRLRTLLSSRHDSRGNC